MNEIFLQYFLVSVKFNEHARDCQDKQKYVKDLTCYLVHHLNTIPSVTPFSCIQFNHPMNSSSFRKDYWVFDMSSSEVYCKITPAYI